MGRTRFTPLAQADLKAINRFIAQDNPAAARRLLAHIRAQCKPLPDYPSNGAIVGGLEPTASELSSRQLFDFLSS